MLGRPHGPSGLAGSDDTAVTAVSALMLVDEQEYAPVEVRCKESREDGSYRLDASRSKVDGDENDLLAETSSAPGRRAFSTWRGRSPRSIWGCNHININLFYIDVQQGGAFQSSSTESLRSG
jgi:hypothetical protein